MLDGLLRPWRLVDPPCSSLRRTVHCRAAPVHASPSSLLGTVPGAIPAFPIARKPHRASREQEKHSLLSFRFHPRCIRCTRCARAFPRCGAWRRVRGGTWRRRTRRGTGTWSRTCAWPDRACWSARSCTLRYRGIWAVSVGVITKFIATAVVVTLPQVVRIGPRVAAYPERSRQVHDCWLQQLQGAFFLCPLEEVRLEVPERHQEVFFDAALLRPEVS